MLRKYTVGVIGAGNMGEALIRGMLRSEQTNASRIIASNRNSTKLRNLKARYGIRISNFNPTVAEIADILILAVKPQDIENLCKEIKPFLRKNHQVIISIAAGVTVKKLKGHLSRDVKLIRVMPNTPALIDSGVSAIYSAPSVTEKEIQLAEEIFGAVGLTWRIDKEKDMDPITALSGTGPAYIYDIVNTLTEAGKSLGLPEQLAKELISHSIIGAARMIVQTGEAPKELWKKVASKGGTTVAAFKVLNDNNFQKILKKAVFAASQRAVQLGKM
ncbi:MAG: pyrroline-5-carboxylate reductase [Pseudomonadota bacterium]